MRDPGLVVEPEEAEGAEGHREENNDLPPEPEHVARRDRRWLLPHHGASCKQPPRRSCESVNSSRGGEGEGEGERRIHLMGES